MEGDTLLSAPSLGNEQFRSKKPTRFHTYGVSPSWLGIFYKDFSPNGLKKSPRLVIFVAKEIKSLSNTFRCGIFEVNQRISSKGCRRWIIANMRILLLKYSLKAMFYRFILYPFVWMLLMMGLNLMRSTPIPSHQVISFLYFDKVFHFAQFCILSFLLLVALSKQHTYMSIRLRAFRVTLIYSFVCLGLISLIHWIIAKEYFEFGDMLAGSIGIGGGFGIFYLIYLYKNGS